MMPLMAPSSPIYPLSAFSENVEMPYMPLLVKGIGVQVGLVASRGVHGQMLQFAAYHKIKPVIETFPMNEKRITEAMDRLERGQIHFRAVLYLCNEENMRFLGAGLMPFTAPKAFAIPAPKFPTASTSSVVAQRLILPSSTEVDRERFTTSGYW